jgi:hypothetical protein
MPVSRASAASRSVKDGSVNDDTVNNLGIRI